MLKKGIIWGLGIGSLTILIYAIAYFIQPALFLSTAVYWTTWLIYVIGLYQLSQIVVKNGGITFQAILRPLFIAYLVANLLYYIFYYLMVYEIDVTLLQLQQEQLAKGLAELNMDGMGEATFTWKDYFFTYIQSAISGFIVAAAIAYSQKHD